MILSHNNHPEPPVRKAFQATEDPPESLLLSYCNCFFHKELEICGPQMASVPLPVVLGMKAAAQKGTEGDVCGALQIQYP